MLFLRNTFSLFNFTTLRYTLNEMSSKILIKNTLDKRKRYLLRDGNIESTPGTGFSSPQQDITSAVIIYTGTHMQDVGFSYSRATEEFSLIIPNA